MNQEIDGLPIFLYHRKVPGAGSKAEGIEWKTVIRTIK